MHIDFANHLLANLFSIIDSIFFAVLDVFLLCLPLASLGIFCWQRLLRQKSVSLPSISLCVALGLSFSVFLSYYLNRMHASLIIVFSMIIIFGYLVFFIELFRVFNQKKNQKNFLISWYLNGDFWIIIFFAFLFYAFHLITLKSTQVVPGGNGNNDIYFWSANAEQLLGRFNFYHIQNGGIAWESLSLDSNGTYLALAFAAIHFFRSAFEVLPIFLGALIVLIGTSLTRLIILLFNVELKIALVTTAIVVFSPFFHYVTYNYFLSEILATFAFMSLLEMSAYSFLQNDKIRTGIAIQLFPFLALLLISYQSGFLIFFCAFSMFFTLMIIYGNNNLKLIDKFKLISSILLLTLLLTILCYPGVVKYLYYRTITVANAGAGWGLPLLNMLYLFSIPSPFSMSNMPFFLSNWIVSFVSIIISLCVMFVFIYKITKNKIFYKIKNVKMIWTLGILFALLVFGYLLIYAIKGGAYQVWKLAAFIILPMSFIPVCIVIIWFTRCLSVISSSDRYVLFSIGLLFIACPLIILSYRSPAYNDLNLYRNFKDLESKLNHTQEVILDLPPYRQTMIAFNVFSKNHKLLPLNDSYIPKSQLTWGDLHDVKWITTERCLRLLSSATQKINNSYSNSIERYVVFSDPSIIGGYSFATGGGECLLNDFIKIVSGLSGEESFGRWTNDDKIKFEINLPPSFKGHDFKLVFNVKPFLSSGVMSQVITPYVNGVALKRISLNQSGNLVIPLDRRNINQSKLNLTFIISHPIRPSDMDKKSLDTRRLGIAFNNVLLEKL